MQGRRTTFALRRYIQHQKNVIVTNIKFNHITIPKHNEKSLMTQYIHVAGVHHQYKLYIIKVVTDLAITKTCKNTLFNIF